MNLFDDLKNTKKIIPADHAAGIPADDPGAIVPDHDADIITAQGVPAVDLPACVDDVRQMVGGWVCAWCADHDVRDLRKASPLVFRSMCSDIGRLYIKPSRILKTKDRRQAGACVASGCNAFDPAQVLLLYDVFYDLCGLYAMIPTQVSFAAFAGVSVSYIRQYTQELTAAGLDIAKKTSRAELEAIRAASLGDPVGRLAVLNNEYWIGAGSAQDSGQGSPQALPGGASFGLIDRPKID